MNKKRYYPCKCSFQLLNTLQIKDPKSQYPVKDNLIQSIMIEEMNFQELLVQRISLFKRMKVDTFKRKLVLLRRKNSIIERFPQSTHRRYQLDIKYQFDNNYLQPMIIGGCCGNSIFQIEKLQKFESKYKKLQKFNKELNEGYLIFTKIWGIYENLITDNFRLKQLANQQSNLLFDSSSNYCILEILAQQDTGKSKLAKNFQSYLIENNCSQHSSSQKKDSIPLFNQENSPHGLNTSIKCQDFYIKIIHSNHIYINLKIINCNNLIVTKVKTGSVSKIQISEEQTKKILEIINNQKRNLSQLQISKQIKLYFKLILSQNKDQLLGGGGCCSKQETNEFNFNTIKINDETSNNNNNKNQNSEFESQYKKWTDYSTISSNIKQDTQLKVQKNLLKQCILDQIIQYEDQINTYQSEILNIFEVYLMLEVTRVSNKPEAKQEEFEEILEQVQSIEQYEQDIPIMELVFYTEILTNLNKVNHKFDESQQKVIIEIKELVNKILNFKKNGDFSSVISSSNSIKQNIHIFNKQKELFPLLYSIEIWLRKIQQFGDKFILISEEEEILFYVKFLFEMNKEQNKQDQIILTLIRIHDILERFYKEKSKHNDKMQIYQQLSYALIKANIHEFLNELMQKQKKFNNNLFLIFSIENQNYRYITLNILLTINSIFRIAFQNNQNQDYQITQNQEYLIEFLCNKYLTEQELAIRVIFEKSHEFVKYFNDNIKIESFKQKMIEFDQQRKEKLQPHVASLKNHERSISSFDDIIKLISENAIQKWERDIKKRQKLNIAQKDDVLLEVRDLYINQMITYLNGNQIFQKSIQNNSIENEHSFDQQNALQDILKIFLSPDYSYRLKQIMNKNGNNEDEGNKFKSQSNQCQILGILAEGGTGKSMFMKKIETLLIEKLTKLNNTETGNYLPILVKCNSLDRDNPSLDEYLKQQGINEDMIKSLKQNERNKLILLDGYDEYTGDYFIVYSTLKIKEWRNTKVIVATRKEKLSEKDACLYFSKQNDQGLIDEMSYSIVRLEEFTSKDIDEYADRYFKQERGKTVQINLIEKDLKNMRDCLTNIELEKLLHLPINLYLFTRMLVNLDDKEIQNLKSQVSDQIGIQQIFFSDQFEREAQSFIDAHIDSNEQKKDKEFRTSIKNCYFEYFQTIGMQMFKNRGVIQGNYLQVERKDIDFNIPQLVVKKIQKPQVISLLDKIKNYINSKIITRVKSEQQLNIYQKAEQQQQKFIEFKHKSLYEYFVARAMKNDFDIHEEKICNLKMEDLEQFKINQKFIMNTGSNQSEQQILIKLYKLIKYQIESDSFSLNYHLNQIEKNNRYIQYLKRSQIKTNTDLSRIDVGASNLISTLFLSNFSYSKLNLSFCSFSKAYISTPKSIEINFDRCNLQNAFLQNSRMNFDSCNTQLASFDAFSKVFDTANIYSFKKVLWGKNQLLYSISETGFINAFKITNSGYQLFKSKQLSQSLNDIQFVNDNQFLVSSEYTLFLINIISFEIQQTHKFKQFISNFIQIDENMVIAFQNLTIFKNIFQDESKQLDNIINMNGSIYNQTKQILVTYQNNSFSLWNIKKNFELINTIQGHTDQIRSVAFSTDGKYLATGSNDCSCKIWNSEKGFELINTIQGHTESILSVAFSADGKYLATGSQDKTCKIWNVEKEFVIINTIQGHDDLILSVAFSADGKFLTTGSSDKTYLTIQGHTDQIRSSFSPNGKYLATGSTDCTCKIWNVEKGFELINTILGHTDRIWSVSFSADGKYLATGSSDNTCKIWNVEKDFELINTIQGHTDWIRSVAFSADGKYLATGSPDNTCKIWNAQKGFELVYSIKDQSQCIWFVAFSKDGKYLATSSSDNTCKIWNAEKGFELINTIEEHTGYIWSVAFSTDGKYLATGSEDNTCKIWNVEKGFELNNTIEAHYDIIWSVAFSTDGKYLATGSKDCTCKIWNVEQRFELINTILGHNDIIWSVAFSEDGKYLATSSSDKTCKIWNTEKGFEIITTNKKHVDWIKSVSFSADGKYLATGSNDYTCKIWNAQQGFELTKTIQEHDNLVQVVFSVDGKYLVTCSQDKICKIWNVEKGFQLINTIQGNTDCILSVAFSVDGKYLATGSYKILKILNAEKGFELIKTIQGLTDWIRSIAFSANRKYLATGSNDCTCKIWNTEKGFELINTIKGHTASILSVAFSADGKYLVTGSQDKTCKVWNAEKGFEMINIIQGHTDLIWSVTFSADGKYLATGSQDKTCKIWNAENRFELINTIQGHTDFIWSVAFSTDGKFLATCSSDKTCKIWNAEKLNLLENQYIL